VSTRKRTRSAIALVPWTGMKRLDSRASKTVLSHLLKQDWKQLSFRADDMRGAVIQRALLLMRQRSETSRFMQGIEASATILQRIATTLLERRSHDKKALIKALTPLIGEVSKSNPKARAAMLLLKPQLIARVVQKEKDFFALRSDTFTWTPILSHGSLAFQASFIAEVNIRRGSQGTTLESLRELCKQERREDSRIDRIVIAAHSAIGLGSVRRLRNCGLALIADAERRIGVLAGACAIADSIRSIDAELETTELARRNIWSYCVGLWCLRLASHDLDSNAWNAVRSRVNELPYASTLPKGKRMDIKHLLKDNPDDTMVTAQGRAESLNTVKEEGAKTTTVFTLRDDTGEITVTLPFSNLARRGMVKGASARVTGVLYSPDGGGANRLRIDRLARAEMAQHSWLDWLHREIGRFFSLNPQGLNMIWSYGAGRDGRAGGVYEAFLTGMNQRKRGA